MKNKRGQIQPTIQQIPKKSKLWLWLIIVLVLIGVGIGVYFWLAVNATDGGAGGIFVESAIPQPPALPE